MPGGLEVTMQHARDDSMSSGAREPSRDKRAELLAAQARVGLLWTAEDDLLFGPEIREPTGSIPCGLDVGDLIDCMIQSTDDHAVRSRIGWVCEVRDPKDEVDWRIHIAPAVDFNDARGGWPWGYKLRFRKEGVASFEDMASAKAAIDEVVAECADVLLAWLDSGEEKFEITHTICGAHDEGVGVAACRGVAWNTRTNAIRETLTHTFVVGLARADRAMGMRVTYARPLATSPDARETDADLREAFIREVERPRVPIYRVYNECRLDPSCPFEVRLYMEDNAADEACDEVEFRITEPDGAVDLIAVSAWTYEQSALTIRGQDAVESDFTNWFYGENGASSEVPARWAELRDYANAAARRLEYLENQGLWVRMHRGL